MIISAKLTKEQERQLVELLRKRITGIGWQISNIKRIIPSYCMHKILMEDDHKPSVERQRRLNPHMQEVVRKEVLKLLDVGLIYPISNSSSNSMCSQERRYNHCNQWRWLKIITHVVSGWRVYIGYRKLHAATRKEHFPLSFNDRIMQELLTKNFKMP